MSRRKTVYVVTDEAPADLKRQANKNGEISMTDAQAEYELLRGTIALPVAKPSAAAKAGAKDGGR